jgi:hypothetical protein
MMACAAGCPPPAAAQGNYEIQMYGSDTVEPGHTMIELHSNFTIEGSKEIIDGVYPTNHAEHETIEITHGFADWFETGFYILTSARNGMGCNGWATISGCVFRSPTSDVSFPWTRGPGRFGRSSIRRSGDGIGR